MRAWIPLCALLLTSCERQPQTEPQRPAGKPEVALLTSLPIVFGESFSLDAERNPLLAALEERFEVVPVDGPEQLKSGATLLAIQPQAMTAERLVALDKWVRNGGRLVLLADPSLLQRGERPLGDRFTPPYAFPDTGLLAHWGLTLEPEGAPFAEEVPFELGGGAVASVSSFGRLRSGNAACVLTVKASAARCRIGKGQVTVVADADFAIDPAPPQNQRAVVSLVAEYQR
jgi:hypothetical protein